jgi:hypothetical protein
MEIVFSSKTATILYNPVLELEKSQVQLLNPLFEISTNLKGIHCISTISFDNVPIREPSKLNVTMNRSYLISKL